jgi:hypothetical protein
VDQIARCLMRKLLAVQRIALVRVISDELSFVLPERCMSASASHTQHIVYAHKSFGSQMGLAPLVVFGRPPSAI